MNEELPLQNQPLEPDWQAPPPPSDNTPVAEPARMSEVGTLSSIFFEPGATFEDLRRKPRFLMAGILFILVTAAFSVLFINKIGFEEIARARMEKNERFQQLPAEQQKQLIEQQSSPVVKVISYVATPIVWALYLVVGGLIYWLGANAMGGSMTFLRGLAVWVYSGFPPMIVSMLANILVLFLKSTDDIDVAASQGGVINANLSFLIDAKTSPVLGAILGTFDLFFIWGWILAVIGLRIVGKISTGAALAIVMIVALLNVAFRVVGALFS